MPQNSRIKATNKKNTVKETVFASWYSSYKRPENKTDENVKMLKNSNGKILDLYGFILNIDY